MSTNDTQALTENSPFYELRFIMRVLGQEGGATAQDRQTALGMAKAVYARWHSDALASRQDQQGQAVIAYATTNEDGDPAMLFFDRTEALGYCEDDQEPIALVAAPLPHASKETAP